jgi:hypothetical protein
VRHTWQPEKQESERKALAKCVFQQPAKLARQLASWPATFGDRENCGKLIRIIFRVRPSGRVASIHSSAALIWN